jgi:hypothetical protein
MGNRELKNLGASGAPRRTGLSGAPGLRPPASSDRAKPGPAGAAPHPFNPLRFGMSVFLEMNRLKMIILWLYHYG